MISLITYPGSNGQFSISPFCVKAAFLLNASGLKWQCEVTNDPRKMPHQKLPVVRVNDRLISGSDAIQRYLEQNGAIFDEGFSNTDKAYSQALIRMAEEHIYFHIVLDRWENDAVWPTIRDSYFKDIPILIRRPLANSLRKSLIKGLKTQGLGRLSAAERMQRLEGDFSAISALLWQRDFLFGNDPTIADYSVGAILGAMQATPVETDLTRRIKGDTIISSYIKRLGNPVVPT